MSECRCGGEIHAKGRCHPCYVYWRRTGTERPERLAVAHASRLLQQQQERRIYPAFGRRVIGPG